MHYLNVPYPDDNKMAVITPNLALWGDKKEWTKEELVSQLKPMCKFLASVEFGDSIILLIDSLKSFQSSVKTSLTQATTLKSLPRKRSRQL